MASEKYLKQSGGYIREEQSVQSSAGDVDAGKIPALNTNGVLDTTIVNSTDSSGGSSDAGKVVSLDATGKISSTMMPTGVGADTALVEASENLAAGDLVNIYNSTGTAKCRKADASTPGKEAHGFILAAATAGNSATVYFEGTNAQCTGLTPGVLYLSASIPGGITSTAPTGSGNVVQRVGFAISTTAMNFQSEIPIVLA
jgi:hypothetical protein